MVVGISEDLKARVDAAVRDVLPEVVSFRRERHAHPELTWQELETSKAVAARLREIDGLEVKAGIGRYGLVAVLEGGQDGPTVGLRADMDALPISEQTGKPYASCNEGVMHACGHDGHMANLFGSLLVLSRFRKELRGRVKAIFQPAEEGGAGARVMCEDGALEDPDVDVIYGLHGWPELPCGKVYLSRGALLASTSEFTIKVRGTGCHAAMPHLGTDQVLAASRIVESLQGIAARRIAPTEPVALTVTQIHGGRAHNVIASEVELAGTLRTMSQAVRDQCSVLLEETARHAAATCGATVEVHIQHGYPPTVNHEGPTDFLRAVAEQVLPPAHVLDIPAPTMGGEDFAFYLQNVPGSYFFLGVDDGRSGGYPSLHHPAYDFNDDALPVGMKIFTHVALGYGATER